ncbi:MAG: ABC transporter substrate-binding protein [Clostridia bacterium]|nr:ABC transporter substrate-binding protein [Clostridia bacterium]
MKLKKLLAILFAALLLVSFVKTPAADDSFTVTDMTGREITFEKPVEKAVALTAADCEIIFALGAEEALVGRGEYCIYPPEATDIPSVQSGYDTNIEQIIALEPDVLFMATMAQTTEQVEQLEKAGIKVVVSDAQNIEGIYTDIRLIGEVMGKQAEAEAKIAEMQAVFDEIKAHPIEGEKTVYFEINPLQWGLWTAGSGTFMNEVAEMMGLKNCFADVQLWAEVSEEQVIERNPDFIVTTTPYYGEGPTPEEEIMGRAGWENIAAVKNENILNLQNDELTRPGPSLAEGAQMLYDFVAESEAAVALAPAA